MKRETSAALRKFLAPEIIFGSGSLELAAVYARNLGARRVMIVTDPGVMEAGWTSVVTEAVKAEDLEFIIFSKVTPNPKDREVMEGASSYTSERCDAIIAVGGGSPIDCAKGIGIVVSNGGHVLDYEGVDRVAIPIPPLICIPTTAGSSADVSQFAIITDTARKVKIAIISKAMVPDVALIDPESTATMPADLTACTGVDALTHAVEAYASNASSHITDLHAYDAISLIAANLHGAIADPSDMEARTAMMMGSLEAGLAFSNASLGAVHAMAHSLGGLLDLPHGACNALLLEWVVERNYDAISDRYDRIAAAIGLPVSTIPREERRDALVGHLRKFRTDAGIRGTIGAMGDLSAHLAELAEKAFKDPCLVTNPAELSRKDLFDIYERAL